MLTEAPSVHMQQMLANLAKHFCQHEHYGRTTRLLDFQAGVPSRVIKTWRETRCTECWTTMEIEELFPPLENIEL